MSRITLIPREKERQQEPPFDVMTKTSSLKTWASPQRKTATEIKFPIRGFIPRPRHKREEKETSAAHTRGGKRKREWPTKT